jgi:uncharacterized SAM-binding protein YcdF (DUF218 family)
MKVLRLSVGAAVVALTLFIIGFVIFAIVTTREAAWSLQPADAIVVLTGGEKRIGEAARPLSEGKARRLLISGVNRQISKQDARRLTGLDPAARSAVARLARQQRPSAVSSVASHRNSRT